MAELIPNDFNGNSADWLVARTRSRHEKKVALYLTSRNIEHLLPLYVAAGRSRQSRSELPLFPGYIFVRIPRAYRLQVLQAPGIADFVCFAGGPHRLANDDVEVLRRCAVLGRRSRPCAYVKGEQVLIADGPFRGIHATVVRSPSSARIVVSIELIQRSVQVELTPADLNRGNSF